MGGSARIRARQSWAAIGMAAALAACGGGGGGDGSAGGGNPAPPPSGREAPLALTAANMLDVGSITLGYGETALIFGQMAHEWRAALAASAGAPIDQGCDGGGSLALRLTDRDGDHTPSVGDRIAATLTRCYQRTADDVLDGELSIDLTPPAGGAQQAGTLTFGSRFLLPSTDGDIRFDGAIAYEQAADRLSSSMRVRSAAAPFTIVWPAAARIGSDVVTALDARKEVRRDRARTTSTLQLRIASDLLGGSVQVATPSAFDGWLDAPPDAGLLTVTGSGPALQVAAVAPIDANIRGLQVTLGAATAMLALDDAATGYLWWGQGITPPGPSTRGYDTQPGWVRGFTELQAPAAGLRQTGTLQWQYSRPLAAWTSTMFATLSPTTSPQPGWPTSSVPLNVKVEGALLTLTPTRPLQPGATYQLFTAATLDSDSGQWTSGPRFTATVVDTISAKAAVASPAWLVGADRTLLLDGRASTAQGTAVASARWRQLSGPALLLSGADTLLATARVAPDATTAGTAVVELEVRNAAGEFDRTQVSLTVVPPLLPLRLSAYGAEGATAASSLLFEASQDGGGYARYQSGDLVDVIVGGTRLMIQGSGGLIAGRTVNWGPGAWPRVLLSLPWPRRCDEPTSGSYEVLDYRLAADGLTIDRLALDMTINCAGAAPMRFWTRVNTLVGLPF